MWRKEEQRVSICASGYTGKSRQGPQSRARVQQNPRQSAGEGQTQRGTPAQPSPAQPSLLLTSSSASILFFLQGTEVGVGPQQHRGRPSFAGVGPFKLPHPSASPLIIL